MQARRVVLVGGHEALGGVPGAVGPGTALAAAVAEPGPVTVVPLTFGRDPELAEAAAQTLRWVGRDRPAGELVLAPALGTLTHLVGWLRAAAGRAGPGEAVLVVAPTAGPEQDAELFRVARLVDVPNAVRPAPYWTEVAFTGGRPGVAEGVERCLRLGAERVAVLPATLVPPALPDRPGLRDLGPLLTAVALNSVVAERSATALHRWEQHLDDGLAAAQPHSHAHTH